MTWVVDRMNLLEAQPCRMTSDGVISPSVSLLLRVEWDASEMGPPDLGDGPLRGDQGSAASGSPGSGRGRASNFDYELRDAGEHVIVLIEQRMHGREEIDHLQRHAQLLTAFKGDEVVRWKLFWDQREALQSAGLSE